jgi:tritrans,polycis-undecaprenyl-diphosphate synthase [geranylgeranyl-diphosphate specific]
MGVLDIPHVTFFAFSTENFSRSEEEKEKLCQLLVEIFSTLLKDGRVSRCEINVSVIGGRSLLDDELKKSIFEIESATMNYSRYFWHVSVVSGGRSEIVAIVKKIATAVQSCTISANCITSVPVTETMRPGILMPLVDLII